MVISGDSLDLDTFPPDCGSAVRRRQVGSPSVARLIGREGSSQQKHLCHTCALQSGRFQTRLHVELDGKSIAVFVCDLNLVMYLHFLSLFSFYPDTKKKNLLYMNEHLIYSFWILICKKNGENSIDRSFQGFHSKFGWLHLCHTNGKTDGILLVPEVRDSWCWNSSSAISYDPGKASSLLIWDFHSQNENNNTTYMGRLDIRSV